MYKLFGDYDSFVKQRISSDIQQAVYEYHKEHDVYENITKNVVVLDCKIDVEIYQGDPNED